ncbi:hypothetical protein SUGI_0327410 [Cryptomeria japonica]|nr:hypothetical protein SUGI_0327410 [Cryptomeria japonica]
MRRLGVFNKPFLMPIEDVFSTQNRGTVVTRRIEQGTIKVDKVAEVLEDPPTKRKVTGIEMFKKIINRDEAENNVDLLMCRLKNGNVFQGRSLIQDFFGYDPFYDPFGSLFDPPRSLFNFVVLLGGRRGMGMTACVLDGEEGPHTAEFSEKVWMAIQAKVVSILHTYFLDIILTSIVVSDEDYARLYALFRVGEKGSKGAG